MPLIADGVVRLVPVEALTPAPWNPRNIKTKAFRSLVRSIKQDPELLRLRPILALPDGTIYAGNYRYLASKEAGQREVWAAVTDIPEQVARARAIRDNNQWGDWVEQDLAELLYTHQAEGNELTDLGFTSEQIDRLLATVGGFDELIVEEDEAAGGPGTGPSFPVQPGQRWEIPSKSVPGHSHVLVCGSPQEKASYRRLLGEDRVPGFACYRLPFEVAPETSREVLNLAMTWVEGPIAVLAQTSQLAHFFGYAAPQHVLAWTHPSSLRTTPLGGTVHWDPVLLWNVPPDEGGPDHFATKRKKSDQGDDKAAPLIKELLTRFSVRGERIIDPYAASTRTVLAAEPLGRLSSGLVESPSDLAQLLAQLQRLGLEPQVS